MSAEAELSTAGIVAPVASTLAPLSRRTMANGSSIVLSSSRSLSGRAPRAAKRHATRRRKLGGKPREETLTNYYNRLRTHLSLNKDAPLGRPVQSHGVLRQPPHFSGLHHSFVRMQFLVGTAAGCPVS
jgi:hypothetical protein